MEQQKQKKLVVTTGLFGLIVLVFFWFISYSNQVGADAEKNRLVRARAIEVLEKTKNLSDYFLSALRGVVADDVQGPMKQAPREPYLQRLIIYNRLAERKETADFLKIEDHKFYLENVIEPARLELQQIWEEARKTHKGACDIEKPNQCYPELTQKMEELRELRRKLEEVKKQK